MEEYYNYTTTRQLLYIAIMSKRHKRIYSEKLRTTWARRGFSLILLRIK